MTTVLRRVRPEQFREIALLIIFVGMVLFFAAQVPDLVSGRTFTRISASVAVVAVLGVGQTLVVLTRNIDLSVGSIAGLVAYFVGTFLARDPGMAPLLAIGISLGIGIVLGAVNGLIVSYGRVPAIITTLGTLAIYRVALVELSGSQSVTAASLPDWLLQIPQTALANVGDLELRPLAAVAIAIVIAFQFLLRYSSYGRRLFAIGSNPDAARVAGFPMQRDVFVAFVLNGALAGVAGFMLLARFGNIETTVGEGLELQVVAAVVVGGVNIFGGSGSMIGVFLGAALIDLLQQGLIRLPGVSEFIRDAILGLLILVAVASDKVIVGRLRALSVRAHRAEDEERLRSGPEATSGGGVAP